jgi:hypothetical protein
VREHCYFYSPKLLIMIFTVVDSLSRGKVQTYFGTHHYSCFKYDAMHVFLVLSFPSHAHLGALSLLLDHRPRTFTHAPPADRTDAKPFTMVNPLCIPHA